MSLTANQLADAPYAATIHTVELDDFGHSFRPVAPGLFTCPIDVARLEALDDRDDLRAVLSAGRSHLQSAGRRPSAPRSPWAAAR